MLNFIKNLFGKYQKGGLFTLEQRDFARGLFVAIIGAIIPIIGQSINSGTFVFDWTSIWHTSLGVAFAYLTLKFSTNSKGQILKK